MTSFPPLPLKSNTLFAFFSFGWAPRLSGALCTFLERLQLTILVIRLIVVVTRIVLPHIHPLILVCIKFHQLLVLLCSSGIPHVSVKNLPAPWSLGFLNGFWWVTYIKSCKAQINYAHQLALAYYINSSEASDRLKMHASLQKYDFLQFLGYVQFFRLTFQRALLGWARVQFTFREVKPLPQNGLHPAECSENIHYWWWCFPITYNSTLFNYL